MTQTKISSDCSALLQQQTVNIDQFRNIIIDYELSCPYTVHTTKPDNPSLIAYMGSLLAGDGTYLFLNLTHSPAPGISPFTALSLIPARLMDGRLFLVQKFAMSLMTRLCVKTT
jgi:hypothetical protein